MDKNIIVTIDEGTISERKLCETWTKTKFYCLNCGKHGVWEHSPGCKAEGTILLCIHCSHHIKLDICNNNFIHDSSRIKKLGV